MLNGPTWLVATVLAGAEDLSVSAVPLRLVGTSGDASTSSAAPGQLPF